MKRAYFPVWVIFLLMLPVLIFFREQTASAVTSSIDQCCRTIFPALFPFFIVTNLLLQTVFPELLAHRFTGMFIRLFHLPPVGAVAFVLALLGGYPIGAKTIHQLYRQHRLRREEAEALLGICNHTGPAIFFGLAGGLLFEGFLLPLYMYLIHIASAVTTGILLRPKQRPAQRINQDSPGPGKCCLTHAIWDAFAACVRICAFVVAFGILLGLMRQLFTHLPSLIPVLLTGFFDLPNGLAALQALDALPLQFFLCNIFINWGGLCIHLQTKAVLDGDSICLRRHTRSKFLQAILSGIWSLPVCFLLAGIPQYSLLPLCLLFILVFLKTKVEITVQSRYNKGKRGESHVVS